MHRRQEQKKIYARDHNQYHQFDQTTDFNYHHHHGPKCKYSNVRAPRMKKDSGVCVCVFVFAHHSFIHSFKKIIII